MRLLHSQPSSHNVHLFHKWQLSITDASGLACCLQSHGTLSMCTHKPVHTRVCDITVHDGQAWALTLLSVDW